MKSIFTTISCELLLRFVGIFSFLFRLFFLLHNFRCNCIILQDNSSPRTFFITLTPIRLSEGGGVRVSSASLVDDCCGERERFSCWYCPWWCIRFWWRWTDGVYKSTGKKKKRMNKIMHEWIFNLSHVEVMYYHWDIDVAFYSKHFDSFLMSIEKNSSSNVSSVEQSK